MTARLATPADIPLVRSLCGIPDAAPDDNIQTVLDLPNYVTMVDPDVGTLAQLAYLDRCLPPVPQGPGSQMAYIMPVDQATFDAGHTPRIIAAAEGHRPGGHRGNDLHMTIRLATLADILLMRDF